jgi:hypothetical protein
MYVFGSKLVCLSMSHKVTERDKNTSLLHYLSIFGDDNLRVGSCPCLLILYWGESVTVTVQN